MKGPFNLEGGYMGSPCTHREKFSCVHGLFSSGGQTK